MAQCRATSKASGKRCRRRAVAGATVCWVHGGAAPQVREAARRRILDLVDPALGTLGRGVAKRRGIPTPTEIAAARDILDRAGLAAAPPEAAGAGVTFQLVVMPAGARALRESQELTPALVPGAPAPAISGNAQPVAFQVAVRKAGEAE